MMREQLHNPTHTRRGILVTVTTPLGRIARSLATHIGALANRVKWGNPEKNIGIVFGEERKL